MIDASNPDKYWKIEDLEIVQTVDLAVSEKTTADYTVISTWGIDRTNADVLLLDVVRARLNGAQHLEALKEAYTTWRPHRVLIESVQFQAAVAHQALAAGIPAQACTPRGDKQARATSFATLVKGGKVFFPRSAEWLTVIEEELVSFPKGTHDDFVDTASIYANECAFDSSSAQVIF